MSRSRRFGPLRGEQGATEHRQEKRDRAAVAAAMVRHGLRPGPRRRQDLAPPAGGGSSHAELHVSLFGGDERSFGERLRMVLEELARDFGPAFSIFGWYLGRRPDLFAARDCLDLGAILLPGPGEGDLLEAAFRDLGGTREIFSSVAPRPRRRGPLRWLFRGRLGAERPVLIELVPQGLEADLVRSLPSLALLQESWGNLPVTGDLESTLDDFRSWLEADLDLGGAVADLETFAGNPEGSRRLILPRPFAYLCGPRRLVFEEVPGSPLGTSASSLHGNSVTSLARRATLAWLVQGLVTRNYVAAFSREDLRLLPGGGLALEAGGPLHTLDEASQGNWWSYLQAAANDDPDGICTWLLRECLTTSPEADEGELHLRLRQIVPFRDGCWTEKGETLAERLFLHWRIARDCGFRFSSQGQRFAQGLFSVAVLGRELEPAEDPLRESLEDLRWMTGWSQLRQWTDLPALARLLERNAESLMELPAKLERLLDSPPPAKRSEPPPVASPAGPVAGILGLVAGTLLVDHLADAGVFGASGGPVSAVVFLVLGAALLRLLWRTP